MLRPPVEPMLAETIPPPGILRNVAYEQKFDGYRALLFTPPPSGGQALMQTRRGSLIQDRFPDLVAAATEQLPDGLLLDGDSSSGIPRRAGCPSTRSSAGAPPAPAAHLPWPPGPPPTSSPSTSCRATAHSSSPSPTGKGADAWRYCSRPAR